MCNTIPHLTDQPQHVIDSLRPTVENAGLKNILITFFYDDNVINTGISIVKTLTKNHMKKSISITETYIYYNIRHNTILNGHR